MLKNNHGCLVFPYRNTITHLTKMDDLLLNI